MRSSRRWNQRRRLLETLTGADRQRLIKKLQRQYESTVRQMLNCYEFSKAAALVGKVKAELGIDIGHELNQPSLIVHLRTELRRRVDPRQSGPLKTKTSQTAWNFVNAVRDKLQIDLSDELVQLIERLMPRRPVFLSPTGRCHPDHAEST